MILKIFKLNFAMEDTEALKLEEVLWSLKNSESVTRRVKPFFQNVSSYSPLIDLQGHALKNKAILPSDGIKSFLLEKKRSFILELFVMLNSLIGTEFTEFRSKEAIDENQFSFLLSKMDSNKIIELIQKMQSHKAIYDFFHIRYVIMNFDLPMVKDEGSNNKFLKDNFKKSSPWFQPKLYSPLVYDEWKEIDLKC